MSTTDWRDDLTAKVRVLQIIVAALFTSCFMLMAIVLVVGRSFKADAAKDPAITYIALAAIVPIMISWVVMPRVIVAQGRTKIRAAMPPAGLSAMADSGEFNSQKASALLILFQTKTIIRASLLEGMVFFLTIAYLIERSPLALVPAIVLMFLVLSIMPTTGRVTTWIEDQMKLLDEERRF